jgi:hypothetical protein
MALGSSPCVHNALWKDRIGAFNPETGAIVVYPGRTFRPESPNEIEPALQPFAEFPWSVVIRAARLAHKPHVSE